jgi:uncharacterized membrane protein
MLHISELKQAASAQLRGHRGVPALLALLVMLLQVLPLPPRSGDGGDEGLWSALPSLESIGDLSLFSLSSVQGRVLGILFFLGALTSLFASAIHIGIARYFLSFSINSGKTTFPVFLEGLAHWGKSIWASILLYARLFLWSLLFFPLGVIIVAVETTLGAHAAIYVALPVGCTLMAILLVYKYVAYSQLFFVLAEYPEVSAAKALKTSVVITRGCRGQLVLLSVSFLGWFFLSGLTMGLGLLLLLPYLYTTQAAAYRVLTLKAFKEGLLVKKVPVSETLEALSRETPALAAPDAPEGGPS